MIPKGEMSEWFKELVLKTSDSQEPWVRIPLSPPRRRSKLRIACSDFFKSQGAFPALGFDLEISFQHAPYRLITQ